jgi:hypothetical protein
MVGPAVESSRRIKSAASPPAKKKMSIAKRYKKQILLWSVEESHDHRPVFQFR